MPQGTEGPLDGTKPTTEAATSTAPKPTPPKMEVKVEEALGEGGKRALEAEREARKDLERQFGQLREGLAQVLGKPSGKASAEDVLTELTRKVELMQHETRAYQIAANSGITKTEDIDLLRSAKDEDTMTRLAARLAEAESVKPGTPKPDLSQGGTGQEHMALNGDPLEQSLRSALGIR